jgi:uncharacterized protein YebE (UPF0316 family)
MSALSSALGDPVGLVPVLIFLAEVCVVAVSTLRIIFSARGMKFLAPLLGFFEVMTWLFAISQIMQNLNDPACFLAFGLGFTVGIHLGIRIEKKLAMGSAVVRVITRRDPGELVEGLRAADFGVTTLPGEGATGPVRVILTVVKRRELGRVVALIKQIEPGAFYSVEELQLTVAGVGPARRAALDGLLPNPFRLFGGGRCAEGVHD